VCAAGGQGTGHDVPGRDGDAAGETVDARRNGRTDEEQVMDFRLEVVVIPVADAAGPTKAGGK
jgi:hypothetical protein